MRSSINMLSPLVRKQYEEELEYIQAHRAEVPGLVRSVANASGYTHSNIYSILGGNTINVQVVHETYNQICRFKGIVISENLVSSDRPEDQQGITLLNQANTHRQRLAHLLAEEKNILSEIRRARKDIKVTEAHMDILMEFSLEEMSDQVAVSLVEYRRDTKEQESYPATFEADTAAIDPEILKAMALLKDTGAITAEGFLSDDEETPSENTLKDEAAEEAYLLARD